MRVISPAILAVLIGLGIGSESKANDGRFCTVGAYSFVMSAGQTCTADSAARNRAIVRIMANAERARAIARTQARLSWTAPPTVVTEDLAFRGRGQRGFSSTELGTVHPRR